MESFAVNSGLVGWIAAIGAAMWAAWTQLSPKINASRDRMEAAEDRTFDSIMGEHKRLLDRMDALVARIEVLEEKNDQERTLRIKAENEVARLMRRLISLGRSDLAEFADS